MHIEQSTIKSTKNSLIDNIAKALSKGEIELKSKCKKETSNLMKRIVKNVLPEYKKMTAKKITKMNITPIQKMERTYCISCKNALIIVILTQKQSIIKLNC